MIEGELDYLWKNLLRGENNKVIKWGGANETENPEKEKKNVLNVHLLILLLSIWL